MILDRKETRMAIVRAVAAKHGIDPQYLLGGYRSPPVVKARWEAFALIKAYTGNSYPEVGRFFGKNHSTVIYGIARFFGYIRTCPVKGLGGACEEANQGMALFGEQLRQEAAVYVAEANAAKHRARAQNPLYAHQIGARHAA